MSFSLDQYINTRRTDAKKASTLRSTTYNLARLLRLCHKKNQYIGHFETSEVFFNLKRDQLSIRTLDIHVLLEDGDLRILGENAERPPEATANEAGDLWAFGLCLFETLMKCPPFSMDATTRRRQMGQLIQNGFQKYVHDNFPSGRKMWHESAKDVAVILSSTMGLIDPRCETRVSAESICRSAYFADVRCCHEALDQMFMEEKIPDVALVESREPASTIMAGEQTSLDHVDASLLRVLEDTLRVRNWQEESSLSLKLDRCVWLVWDEIKCRHLVIRLSVHTSLHRSFDFTEFWYAKFCPYLPVMKRPSIVEEDGRQFVLEEYEYIGETSPKRMDGGHCESFENNAFYQDLLTFLDRTSFENPIKWKLVYDVVCGLSWLERCCWCHGDLSAENVVVGNGKAKIVDFESSLHYDPLTACATTDIGPTKSYYRAPEMDSESNKVYPQYVDVWSLGVIIFALASKNLPFASDVAERRREFAYLKKFGFAKYVTKFLGKGVRDSFSDSLVDLLERIFVVFDGRDMGDGFTLFEPTDDRTRLAPVQVMEHRFFDKFRRQFVRADSY